MAQYKPKPAPELADTAVDFDTPQAATPAKADTARPATKALPTQFIPPTQGGGAMLKATPGYVVSTCMNDSGERTRQAENGWHVCRPGEGFVANEDMCETDPATGLLLFKGDNVLACTTEVADQRLAYKQERARVSAGIKDDVRRRISELRTDDPEMYTDVPMVKEDNYMQSLATPQVNPIT